MDLSEDEMQIQNPPLLKNFGFELYWEDDELVSLICKEKLTSFCFDGLVSDVGLMAARSEAVDWILRVHGHYGFSALTIVLAVNYFDRFILSMRFQQDKPWMSQLCAVACLSLAAKMEEIEVPLLLDLQVEGCRYVFEAKTIQRMELLVLSTLQWRMNPVTPISFFDHVYRRLGMKSNLHWEFSPQFECILISTISDSRFVGYPPSILAMATMLLVIKDVEPRNLAEYQNKLVGVLKLDEDKVYECYELMLELQLQKHLWSQPKPKPQTKAAYDAREPKWYYGCIFRLR